MPHLSPMNWILTLLTLWTVITFLMSSSYFMSYTTFMAPSLHKSKLLALSWLWHLQGGRAKQ